MRETTCYYINLLISGALLLGFDLAQNYFACFFSLPIVISSMRWGVGAGRKTMVCHLLHFGFFKSCMELIIFIWQVATTMLLFVLSGPVKASTYLVSTLSCLRFLSVYIVHVWYAGTEMEIGCKWRSISIL